MRDIVLTLFLVGSLPFILKRPWYGVMLWVWVSVMSPHRLTWGFAINQPFASMIALTTLVSILITREPRQFPLTPVTGVLIVLVAWMCFTTIFALDPVAAPVMLEKVLKTMLMVLVTAYVLNTRKHILILFSILTLSVAFYGVKGGWFTLTSGGIHTVYGPGGSFIQENNSLALAVIMMIPLLRFLHTQVTNVWLKRGLVLSMILCGFSALGSHSRGALLAIAAMLAFFWLKSRNKMVTLILLLAIVPFAIAFMPDTWDKRMQTIENYEEDASAMGRINTWRMAINVAADRPLTGGGFEMYNRGVFARYAPNPNSIHTAHSIYFQMLGEHGPIGLALFLLLGILTYANASWIIAKTRGHKEWQWAGDMSRMIQVSMVGFAAGGAFLNLAYYDVPYYLIIVVVLTRRLIEKELGGNAAPFFQRRQAPAAPGSPGQFPGSGGATPEAGLQGRLPGSAAAGPGLSGRLPRPAGAAAASGPSGRPPGANGTRVVAGASGRVPGSGGTTAARNGQMTAAKARNSYVAENGRNVQPPASTDEFKSGIGRT